MTTFTEKTHTGGFVLSLANGNLSMENGVLNSGQNLAAGTVLGRILTAGSATAVGTPTGNGAITVGAAIGAATLIGTYKLVCVAASTNAGTFNFYAPDGTLIRQITVGGGATSSDHLTITIADGAADFAVNDTWTIAVTGGDYSQLALAGTDGTQIAAGVLYGAVDASAADTACALVAREATLIGAELTWPASITAGQKATATAQLARNAIVLR